MSAVDTHGDQNYWIEGHPFEGIRLEATDTGTVKYWFEGQPAENLTPQQNFDTGKFFLDFE
jgi:hypothetical protein